MRLALLITLVAGLIAHPLGAADPAADKDLLAQLSKLEKDSWEAVRKQDAEFFKGYMADDFTGCFADGIPVTKQDFIKGLADFKIASFGMEDVRLLRVNADAAFVLYRLRYEGTFRGQRVKKDAIQASSLYVRRDGKWLELFYQETEVQKK